MKADNLMGDQSSVASQNARDLLANARCLKCGYPLRGLPENRCPECGEAFDPAEMAAGFRALWPGLLKWYLVASVAAWVIRFPDAMSLVWRAFSPHLWNWRSSSFGENLSSAIEMMFLVFVGSAAAVGLHRGRDWGRRLCIAMLTAICLARSAMIVPPLLASGWPVRGSHRFWPDTVWLVRQAVAALRPLLPAVFLLTGLPRCSLARGPAQIAPLLPHGRFGRRRDWLLLLMLLLLSSGIYMLTGVVLRGMQLVTYGTLFPHFRLETAVVVLRAAAVVVYVGGGIAAWCRPRWVRPTLATLVAILSCVAAVEVLLTFMFYTSPGRTLAWTTAGPLVLGAIANVVPTLSLCLFVFLRVGREEIREV
jgi:hypothetical protein